MKAVPLVDELDDEPLRPHPARLAPDSPGYERIVEAHESAIEAGAAGYLDPLSGLFVMTAVHHLERGSCCDSGCRHCPYLHRRG